MNIIFPLEVWYTKNKRFKCNLNTFQRTHSRKLATIKKAYGRLVAPLVMIAKAKQNRNGEKLNPPYHMTWRLYVSANRTIDLENVLPIVSKFVLDELVKGRIIEDDSVKYIPKVTYKYCGVDKKNPRAELEIRGV